MKQTTYQQFDDLLEENPLSGFYNKLESIVDTTVPKFKGHKKAVAGIYQSLEDLGEKASAVISTEIDKECIFDYNCETSIREDAVNLALLLYGVTEKTSADFKSEMKNADPEHEEDVNSPQDYLFYAQPLLQELVGGKKALQEELTALEQKEQFTNNYIEAMGLFGEFTHGLAMKTKQVVHELYMEKCDEIYQENDQLLGSIDTDTFSKESTQNTLGALAKMKVNMGKTSQGIGVSFPDILDYSIVLPSVIRMLRKEYTAFRDDQAGYLEAEHQDLMAEMRKTLGETPPPTSSPPEVPPNTTMH